MSERSRSCAGWICSAGHGIGWKEGMAAVVLGPFPAHSIVSKFGIPFTSLEQEGVAARCTATLAPLATAWTSPV